MRKFKANTDFGWVGNTDNTKRKELNVKWPDVDDVSILFIAGFVITEAALIYLAGGIVRRYFIGQTVALMGAGIMLYETFYEGANASIQAEYKALNELGMLGDKPEAEYKF